MVNPEMYFQVVVKIPVKKWRNSSVLFPLLSALKTTAEKIKLLLPGSARQVKDDEDYKCL